ncbi:SCO7613 C-terminal domain-containing membrane protein [Streptomyces sp. cmx-4-9]|uniref:SCO7613 C-terminal domain-containing membrane protein n=1 Tax=Streptomyces sp. cmx-4-9 TaxID=2790941 RepID=UPI00397EB6DC
MNTSLPPAEELALVDRELAWLDHRRMYLLTRRDRLLHLLRQPGPAPAAWGPPAGWVPAPGPGAPAPAEDASAPSAQNVLLALGVVLLAVAATAFTLVSWGAMGIAGRSAVLAVVTAAALGAPVALLRRGLRATAESVAAVGLLLTVLDAYALYVAAGADTGPAAYAAAAAAVCAALWAGYGLGLARRLPALRIPLPAAVLAAQWPLPLAALAGQSGPLGLGWALLVTAVLDVLLALRVRALPAPVAWVPAGVLGAGALLTGAVRSWSAASAAGAVAPGVLLGAGAALAVAVAVAVAAAGRGAAAWPVAAAGGLAAVVGLGGVARPELGPGWAVVAHLLVALPLLAAVRAGRLAEPVRRGLLLAGALAATVAALGAWCAAAAVLAARTGVLDEVWAASTPGADPFGAGAPAVVVLLLAAAAAGWLSRALSRPEPPVVAVALAWSGLFTAPALLDWPAAVVFAVQVVVTAAAGAYALKGRTPGAAVAAGVCALLGAGNVSLGALDGRTATFAVWGLLGAGCAAGAAQRSAPRPARSVAAVCAVGYAGGLLLAASAAAGRPPAWWGLPLLAVPAAAAVFGPRLGGVRVPAEIAAAVCGALAVLWSAGRPGTLGLALALAGVVCAGAAVRAERRPVGWAAGTLFVLAAWVRLAGAGVAAPEAYSLPVTVPALAVGLVRRRRDPSASSWTAYGPGLAATLLPSLLAALEDRHWLRPLLLGLAALAVTLAGARRRLQAPLLLGGAVLAGVALHELAPYVVQVVGALPRWLPPALAGLLLLAAGATYEKRLGEARRLRDALGRLR